MIIRKMKNIKSQVRMQEMAFMLVGVILFFVFVGLFGFAILFNMLRTDAQQTAENNALLAVKNLAGSPEFYCASSKTNCIDADKVMALSNNQNYDKFYSFSRLEIIKSSAFKKNRKDMVKCTMANYPNCEEIVVYDKNVDFEKSVSSYVALCRVEIEYGANYQKCELAKLVVATEDKTTKS
jgi:hypothetical protein